MINVVPAAKGISEGFAPREIVTGRRLNIKHLKSLFGEYIDSSIDADVNNNIKGRTHPFISLGHSRNWQGYQMCFNLETGKVLLRCTITRFSMPERIIRIIKYWVKSQKNAGFKNNLEFWDIMKNKYDWGN